MPIQLSGSLVITGSITTTGVIIMSGSIASASYSSNSDLLQGTGSVGFTTTASFNAVSSSQQQISSSLLVISSSYATTGSNSFRANQSITGSLVVSSTITAQTLVVQTVTSSILYSSGSNIFGNQLANTQTFTGSVNITGSLALAGNITSNGTAVVLGSGTTNYLPKFTGTSTIGNSLVYDSGTGVIIGGTSPIYLKFNVQETSANRVAILYRGTQGADASMVTTFGTPYLSIGGQENLVNSIQTIGFGFTNGTSYIQPAEIGFKTTSLSGYTKGDLVFATRDNTTNSAPTERMRLDASGNLGLGVTPSAWNSNSKALQLPSFISLSQQNSGALNLMSYAYESSANTFTYGATGVYATRLSMNPNDGVIAFYNSTTGTAGAAITFTQAMTLTAAGNLLVGNTSSVHPATGRGVIEVNGASTSILGLTINGAAAGYLYHGGTNLSVWNSLNGAIEFGTNNTTRLTIASTGAATFSSTIGATGANISTSTICTSASTTLGSSRGIVIDANTTTNNAFVPIGFSWASSISSYNPTWGMALKTINYNAGTADLVFYTGGDNVRLTIGNGGAATFSSSVTAGGFSTTTCTFAATSAGTNYDVTIPGYSKWLVSVYTAAVYHWNGILALTTFDSADFDVKILTCGAYQTAAQVGVVGGGTQLRFCFSQNVGNVTLNYTNIG